MHAVVPASVFQIIVLVLHLLSIFRLQCTDTPVLLELAYVCRPTLCFLPAYCVYGQGYVWICVKMYHANFLAMTKSLVLVGMVALLFGMLTCLLAISFSL